VVLASEGEEERIAAELQQRASLGVCDAQHLGEHVVENLGELLGAYPPMASETL
jgi:hypothetical protein